MSCSICWSEGVFLINNHLIVFLLGGVKKLVNSFIEGKQVRLGKWESPSVHKWWPKQTFSFTFQLLNLESIKGSQNVYKIPVCIYILFNVCWQVAEKLLLAFPLLLWKALGFP